MIRATLGNAQVVPDPLTGDVMPFGPIFIPCFKRHSSGFGMCELGKGHGGRHQYSDPGPCGSGWTGDRCSKRLGHGGRHSNE